MVYGQCCLYDGLVPRAAAQVPLNGGFDLMGSRLRGLHPQGVKRHDKTGGTEAALAAMEIDHSLLHGMQTPLGAGEMFNRDDMTAVQRRQKTDAGIHGFIVQHAILKPPNHNRTGPAIAFRTAFLGAGQTLLKPQIVQKRQCGFHAWDRLFLSVQKKANVALISHAASYNLSRAGGYEGEFTARDCTGKRWSLGNTFNRSLIMTMIDTRRTEVP